MANSRLDRRIPFGLWPSTIAAADVAAGSRRFGLVQGDGPWVYWTEGRPSEGGRQALLRAKPEDAGSLEELLPPPWSARSRVHEYGGGEFLAAGEAIYFTNDRDQDIYRLIPGAAPERVTSEPALRFADFALDPARERLIAVAERHGASGSQPENLLVTIGLGKSTWGQVAELARGRSFYASPRLSPDGTSLAFVAWDLPDMPWDQSDLLLARMTPDGRIARSPRRIAGGGGRAAAYPGWAPDGSLLFVADDDLRGRLMRWTGKRARPLSPAGVDVGRPLWSLGSQPYAIDRRGRVVAAPVEPRRREVEQVRLIDSQPGTARTLRVVQASALEALSFCDAGLVAQVQRFTLPTAIACFDPARDAAPSIVRSASDAQRSRAAIALPRVVYFQEGREGRRVYGLYYPPTSSTHAGPPGAKPPAIVMAHGGPTAAADRGLKLRVQFYTSRGIAVFDVDYAGSTGYGRAYRERLDGQWGIADVHDCECAALYLGMHGLADPSRIAIAGGSAGGYTTLMALATADIFAAGSSHYGISDLGLLMQHTHKFESGYLHRLLGTTPDAWKEKCRQRSPIAAIETISAPLILFQGLDDKVVPPEQSRLIAERLRARGRIAELHEFAGGGHGFRRQETIIAVLEAELAFFRKALRIGAAEPTPQK